MYPKGYYNQREHKYKGIRFLIIASGEIGAYATSFMLDDRTVVDMFDDFSDTHYYTKMDVLRRVKKAIDDKRYKVLVGHKYREPSKPQDDY